MSSLWVAVISASAALAGVLLADVRQRGKEYNDRLAALRREAFVEVYAWTLQAEDALDAAAEEAYRQVAPRDDVAEIDIPLVSHDLVARLRIYLDTEMAHRTRGASTQLSETVALARKTASEGLPGSAREFLASSRKLAYEIGNLQAMVQIQAKDLDTTATTRMRWRLRRVIHPPLSTDDPAWSELQLRERFRRRAQELRRPSTRRRHQDPLTDPVLRG